MSLKARNLTYDADAAQPAFLRRLRGEIAGDDSSRREPAVPRNKKLVRDEEEDGPTYVMEGTNESLTKAEYEALAAGKETTAGSESGPMADKADAKDTSLETKESAPTKTTASKKRKAVKIVGNDEDAGSNAQDFVTKKPSNQGVKKPKKKAKIIKLSFGDQEDD
ncbi:hypothetical protein M011DRAFT_476258 [Sporormia fimetaria CBS 119925]|uniref:DUF4604 domain-containing protein n=1 Tax=Sporormia fimetaria CBS 119925 TaxID=1340428 RepID=A0A6A6VI54_9PLEO|nr:hypothetical protein M011DRAFT_476258 [Sporormia fimetaria CBS 119925]